MTATPRVSELRPDVWRIEVPLRGHGVGQVNVYALKAAEGTLVIDSGWGTEESSNHLDAGLTEIGVQPSDVIGVLLTHCHADHCGNAGRLAARSGAWIGMHALDAELLEDRFFRRDKSVHAMEEWARGAGVPEGLVGAAGETAASGARRVDPLNPDRLIEDGDLVRHGHWTLEAIHTPGHTPGHLCFHEKHERILFTGDHVLARMNTGPGSRPQGTSDPVDAYLRSLRRLHGLDVDLALPGHLGSITHLDERLATLTAHHEGRMSEIRSILDHGTETVWEVAKALPRSRAWDDLPGAAQLSACGETQAHLRKLESDGHAVRIEGVPLRWVPSKS